MNRAMFSIVLLALTAHSYVAEIFKKTAGAQDLNRLYRAAVDIAMTCYGDPGHAVGIIGGTDDSILKKLQLNHFIRVVLMNGSNCRIGNDDNVRLHELQVLVIALHSPQHLISLLFELIDSIWWNNYANFLTVDMSNELTNDRCSWVEWFMFTTTRKSMLNIQFICHLRGTRMNEIVICNSNSFTHRAPKVCRFVKEYNFKSSEHKRNYSLFARFYREGGQSCEFINFAKTGNVRGYPLGFIENMPHSYFQRDCSFFEKAEEASTIDILEKRASDEHRCFIDSIVITMKVSAVMSDAAKHPKILLQPLYLSSQPTRLGDNEVGRIMKLKQVPVFAVTQHIPHMSQLDKILSIIDRESPIHMWLVYLITFLFFKFFLDQAVMPALLNLARLTCNPGLTKLPQNVATTLYLTSLLISVITLQAIYTGNLTILLTTIIPT